MIKKIINFISKDIASARRDNIILYMLIAPILIAVIMRFFIPSLESSTFSFAVYSSDSKIAEALKDYGDVIVMDSREKVEARVEGNDDLVGIVEDGGRFSIILEGNEKEDIREAAIVILGDILKDSDIAEYRFTSLGDERSLIREYSAIFIILMAVMIAGMMAGFNIIDEKESGAIRAISVTPLRLSEYLFARGIIILFFSLLLSTLTSTILLGFDINYIKLITGVIFSSGIGIILGVAIGGAADNQIKGIAIVKVVSLPYTLIPVASIFIPANYHIFLYPFPNYWMYRTFANVFIDRENPADYWISNLATVAIIIVIIFIMIFTLRKKLKLRL